MERFTPLATDMARILDDETANKIARLWTRVEDAVNEFDDCMQGEEAKGLGEEWKRFRDEFDRFDEVVTDAIEA